MVKVAGRGGLSDLASVSIHPESAARFSAKYWDTLSEWGGTAETASQNIDSERDAVSKSTLKRKPHPALMRGLRTKAGP